MALGFVLPVAVLAPWWLARRPVRWGAWYGGIVFAVVIAFALKMANQWEKFVILRAGKLHSVKGPGLFLIVPVLDEQPAAALQGCTGGWHFPIGSISRYC